MPGRRRDSPWRSAFHAPDPPSLPVPGAEPQAERVRRAPHRKARQGQAGQGVPGEGAAVLQKDTRGNHVDSRTCAFVCVFVVVFVFAICGYIHIFSYSCVCV